MNLIVGIDEFGRTVKPIANTRKNKAVGMFYWPWMHDRHGRGNRVYDSTKIKAMENGYEKLCKSDCEDSPVGKPHWWGEPLYGYYNSNDEYVLRKHLELIACAGVDFIIYDTTNAYVYDDVYEKMMRIICQMRTEGIPAPQVSHMCNTKAAQTVSELYRIIYSKRLYEDAWYKINGKPLMIGYPDEASEEEKAFFHFRQMYWPDGYPTGKPTENTWTWLDWNFPPQTHGNVITIACASHPNGMFSYAYSRNLVNWGRGFSFTDNKNNEKRALTGSFFQENWDYALSQDPDMICIGAWDEWISYKQPFCAGFNDYGLWDCVSMEYSRDVEIMKGGYNDAYYIQLIQNIRRFKGTGEIARDTDGLHTININDKKAEAWNGVKSAYKDTTCGIYGRNYHGFVKSLHYKTAKPQNSIKEIKVANDKDYIYFYIQCEKPVKGEGNNHMNLFIGTGTPSLKGWNGYEYVLNRLGMGSIEELNPDFSGVLVGTAATTVFKNIIQTAIPRTALGLSWDNNSFYFKVADGVENPSDIMDYYVTGKSLPMGRLSFQYFG